MTVAETFETMKALFNPTVITGGVEKPDLTLSMSDKDWLAIADGKLDAMNAFMTGKVKAAGDISLAMRVNAIFPRK